MDILKATAHRPFPLISNRWILKQHWRNVALIHWKIPPNELRPLIPKQLDIDTYQGEAWIGMIIFDMEAIYLRGLERFSLTPPFSEINMRTYVSYQGVPGIYFLSIDVDNWASQEIARRWYRLPYQPANISYEKLAETYHYESNRKVKKHITSAGTITPFTNKYRADKGLLDYWLIERYRLYSLGKNAIVYQSDIHHQPWVLQKAESEIYDNTLLSELNIGLAKKPFVTHFSSGVDTLFWQIKKLPFFST